MEITNNLALGLVLRRVRKTTYDKFTSFNNKCFAFPLPDYCKLMLQLLPPEILINIFTLLQQEDQLQCILVCSHFEKLIKRCTLFHSLYVSSVASLDILISKIENEPSIGNIVKHVALILNGMPVYNKIITLLQLLPNVETFFSDRVARNDPSFEHVTGHLWPEQIKQIFELPSNIITRQLLSCNPLHHLTRLVILGNSYSAEIIPLLKNAPLLKHLIFGRIRMTFGDFNIINESLPLLQSIEFQQVLFEDHENYSIKPALSVTEYTFQSIEGEDVDTRIRLLDYIRQTYPNLSKLEFSIYNASLSEEDTMRLVDNGWQPFFKAFGTKLETLQTAEEEYDMHFFYVLDKSACQIRNLNMRYNFGTYDALKSTEQVSYIETLHVYFDIQEDFEFIRHLRVLKELKVDVYYQDDDEEFARCISFNQIIENAPPTLKSLSFISLRLLTIDINENSIPVNNIEHLSFSDTVPPWNVDRFISTNFPRLRKLELDDCKIYGRTFNLITTNLTCFTLTGISTKEDKILVFTLRNKEMRWISPLRYENYPGTSNGVNEFLYPPIRSTPANDITVPPSFTLICNSIDNIYLSKKKN